MNQHDEHTAAEPTEDGTAAAETDGSAGPETAPETPSETARTEEALAAEIETLREKLREAEDRLLRKEAEFRNYRRRTEEEKVALTGLGKRLAIQRFLGALDDFERSFDAAEQAEAQQEEKPGPAYYALKEGFGLVHRKIMDELAKEQVEPIEAVGQPFDERVHEAVMQREAEGTESGVVVGEAQRGYRMGDHILRHSKVIVSA